MSDASEHRRKLRLNINETVVLVVDMQDGFRTHFGKNFFSDEIIAVTQRLLKAVQVLGLKTYVAEHIPETWGPTARELQPLLKDLNAVVVPKVEFSMYQAVKEHLSKGVKSVIICGVAAHCCVFQSVVDLLDAGLSVHVVANATSTNNIEDRIFAFEELKRAGAVLTTADMAILQLVRGSAHPKFKEIIELLQEPVPETGLVSTACTTKNLV